jgi:NADPH:quinone reductase-like Zn-dependent oxidoreductase
MRAVVYDRYGPPEVLRLDDVEPPVPGDDEVLVRIHATTVARADCATREANRRSGLVAGVFSRLAFGIRRPRRRILGSEFAGEVEAVGAAVSELAVGDRVFGTTGLRFGAHAERIAVREGSAIAPIPAGMTFDEAAAVCDGGLNAMTSLERAGVRAGDRVLVYGASGSIGTAAVQLAVARGADVTAVCNTRHVELARSLGARRVIDYTLDAFIGTGERYDVIFDAVGKLTFRQCRGSLRPGGRYIATDGLLNAILALVSSRTGGRRALFPFPRTTKANVLALRALIEAGRYRTVIDRRYPLERVVEATRYVETEQKTGNVVLTVGVGADSAPRSVDPTLTSTGGRP